LPLLGRKAAEPWLLCPYRWQIAGADRHEVLVGGEGLQRGPLDVLGTLLIDIIWAQATDECRRFRRNVRPVARAPGTTERRTTTT
jgi:hypothetical protein